LFASAGQSSHISIFDSDTWNVVKKIETHDVRWTVTDVQFAPKDPFIFYASINSIVHMCNISGDEDIDLDFGGPNGGGSRLGIWCIRCG
jgi:hypothetical protein